MTSKIFKYDCIGETLSFAESLGWENWLDEAIVNDSIDPQTVDAVEGDALDYIESQGYHVVHAEVAARRIAIERLRKELLA